MMHEYVGKYFFFYSSSSLFQVLVTNLDVETVTHYEPANFWIGPSAVSTTILCLYLALLLY